ncbi:Disks large-like protein 5 [Armadillidium nasatum]|uniref:Disks large-like protein 5 n=1 Tax=Armadillidium nasatum TaxID=96803 RepID=A0A5N5SR89_9CRUS|nr:Disks large-like protein 5 [Armadillidium nasatum]
MLKAHFKPISLYYRGMCLYSLWGKVGQPWEAMTQEDSGEAINQLYITTLRKYEALKDECDSFRKRYTDIASSHSNNISKLELSQEEITRLKKQYEEVVREKKCLKQQCTEAIMQWDTALRDKNRLQEEAQKLREKNEELLKEMNTQMAESQNLNKDFKRLQSERNAAMQEYTLVMSERDTVHKEMDKLQEELNAASKRIKSIEQSTLENNKERETMHLQLETLKREVAASLHDRDKAIKECNELRERYGAEEDSSKEWENSYKDYDTYKQERDMKLKDASDLAMTTSHDLYSKAQKERLENLDQANQEIDRLRKTVEKLQSDLDEAKREAEVSKGRRDWAFSERDKIVLERESIRAHCDKLRHERDRAVSELAEALRDSDDMMKQRNEASKELKELREKLEAMQEKTVSVRHVIGHNNSRDSAIDTDMQEWELETLQLQIGILSERDLGLEISGGSDDAHYGSSDGAVYVASLSKDSPFEGKLRLHDQLIRINGFECQGASQSNVNNAILKCGGWVQVTVRRRRSGGRTLHTTQIHCRNPSHHGLILQTGIYIANILPGSPAAREGNLAIGDRVLNVNGKPVEATASCEEAQALLDSSGEVIQLTTLKSVGGSSSLSAPLSSSSSGHNMTEDDKAFLSTSPSKDAYALPLGRGTRDLGLKLTRGGEERRVGSSERVVYNVTKPTEEKGSTGGPWGQFKNIVKPRRHSKERGDGRSESREKEDKRKSVINRGIGIPTFDQEKENAIAELDSVLESYRYTSSSSSSSGTAKRSKKKEKSGGTWPKYRGGIITLNDINIGTIKAPVPRKERPPLSMYLTSVSSESNQLPSSSPKTYVSPYDLDENKHHNINSSGARGNNCGLRANLTSNNNPRSAHPMFSVFKSIENTDLTSPYKISEHYGSPNYSTQPPGQQIYSNLSSRIGVGASVTDRKDESEKEHQEQQQQHHSSPDTSLDFSVRSGNVGKEELEYYVKKNWVKYPHNETEGGPLHHQPSSLPPVYLGRPIKLASLGDYLPPNSRIPHSHSGLYSPTSGALRASPAFAPYSTLSYHPHSHPHTVSGGVSSYSSPSYSSPPPLPMLGGSPNFLSPSRSGDSILSSPGPDRDPRDIRNYYENQISSSPTFWLNLSSGSGLGGFYHSASPSVDTGGGLKRAIHPHHPHGLRIAQEEPAGLTHSHVGPPSYHDYQRTVSTIPRKRDEERLRIATSTGIGGNKNGRNTLMERGFDRGEQNPERESPMPRAYPVTQISHSVNNPHMLQKKAQSGDLRSIYIEKEKEPLGIQIRCLESGGVYVGLCVGDQLLEVCGINMRSANKTLASTVLSQCGNSVTMLVQYNPEKYHEAESWDESSSGGSMIMGSRSGTPTPQNSPKAARSSPIGGKDEEEEEEEEDLPPSSSSTLRAPLDPRDTLEHSLPPSARSTLTRPQATHLLNVLKRQESFTSILCTPE